MKTMYSIGELAKQFNLSRSTLLYYDSIGLLRPSGRTESEYRKYSLADKKRLEQICAYRQMGISLQEIACRLEQSDNEIIRILENHFARLADKIRLIREQQFAIIHLLKNPELVNQVRHLNKEKWYPLNVRWIGVDVRRTFGNRETFLI